MHGTGKLRPLNVKGFDIVLVSSRRKATAKTMVRQTSPMAKSWKAMPHARGPQRGKSELSNSLECHEVCT